MIKNSWVLLSFFHVFTLHHLTKQAQSFALVVELLAFFAISFIFAIKQAFLLMLNHWWIMIRMSNDYQKRQHQHFQYFSPNYFFLFEWIKQVVRTHLIYFELYYIDLLAYQTIQDFDHQKIFAKILLLPWFFYLFPFEIL